MTTKRDTDKTRAAGKRGKGTAPALEGTPQEQAKGTADALDRMQEYQQHAYQWQAITPAEAVALCDRIAGRFDDDELTFDLIVLLRGLYRLYEDGLKDRYFTGLETVLIFGEQRAYMHTAHAHAALDEFARLDPDNLRDRRVLRRRFSLEDAAAEEQP